ncbi:MAG: cation diffusion facilitator family transporter [Gammaproteobacteria bacterium]|jgi:cation diffusion facilitator family transporter
MSEHHHHGIERNAQTRKAAIVGAVTNLVLTVVKIVFGYIGQSQALIVDGIHSLSDLLSDALVLFASHHANQEPDDEHPYGHGRFETAATLALGILLMLVAFGIGWDSVERLFDQESMQIPGQLALYAAAFSILANEALYWYTLIVARKIRSKLLEANAWHHRSDAVSSIVVFAGIGGSLLGISNLDTVAALIVCVMIAKIGWTLGWQALEELVDKSLDQEEVEKVSGIIDAVDGVRSLHMLRTRKTGHMSAADVHVLVDPKLTVSEGHMVAVAVEEELKNNIDHLDDVTVHVDPENDEEVPPCDGLPLRNEVIEHLTRVWEGIDCVNQNAGIALHYLSGKIDVDLLLPLHCFTSVNDSEELKKRLQEKVSGDERFNKIDLLYKAP